MVTALILFFMLPILVSCTGNGNIHLLEEDVSEALRACSEINNKENESMQKRLDTKNESTQTGASKYHVDAKIEKDVSPYNHTQRNKNTVDQMHTFNVSDYNYLEFGAGNKEKKGVESASHPGRSNENKSHNNDHNSQIQRVKRKDLLVNKYDNDQCLSQCVFTQLHMVDSKGIPREAEVWNKIQLSLTSEQSRVLLRNQIQACFQELQSESEEDGCSYSNKLESCLMLRFTDRKTDENKNSTSIQT